MTAATYLFGVVDKDASYLRDNYFSANEFNSIWLMIFDGGYFIGTPEGEGEKYYSLESAEKMVDEIVENSEKKLKEYKSSIKKIIEAQSQPLKMISIDDADRIVQCFHGMGCDEYDYGVKVVNSLFCYRCIYEEGSFEDAIQQDVDGYTFHGLECDPDYEEIIFVKKK